MGPRKKQQQQGRPGPRCYQPLTWSSCSPWACKVSQLVSSQLSGHILHLGTRMSRSRLGFCWRMPAT